MNASVSAPPMTTTTAEGTPDAITLAREAGQNPLDYLRQRGFVHEVTDEAGLHAAFAAGPITAYIGFDPTAVSLHIGNLVGIMFLATLQRFGHRPLVIAGGGTALVGDPSGKTSARAMSTPEQIEENLKGIIKQFDRHLDFQGGRFVADPPNPPALLLNNAEWLLKLGYIEFLRDIGRHFSVNEMLAIETYKNRIETTGLNFVEFNYRLVQSYDYLYLFRNYGCILQAGGSDQWTNITGGVELVRKVEGKQVFGLVYPLITTASGEKMGKSAGNAVWLDPSLTSPFDFYQYWVNVDDASVPKLLRTYTFLPEERIQELTSVEGEALREAKQVLAFEATALTHGLEAAEHAREGARALFSGRRDAADLLDDPNIPTTEIPASEVTPDFTLAQAFVRAGLASSRNDARRNAKQGGLSVDDERVQDVDRPLAEVLSDRKSVLLRHGKKRFMRLTITDDPSQGQARE